MKFDKKKLLATVSAAALVLAVGACSSGGDDDGNTAERDAVLAAETARDAALAALAKAQGVQTDADLAAEELTAAQQQLKTAMDDLATAMANLAIANGMQGDLTETPDADLTAAQLELKTAQVAVAAAMTNLTTAEGKLTTANNNLKAALVAVNLEPASDTMSVEDQIAANTATLRNRLATIEMETEAERTVAARNERIAREAKIRMAIGIPDTSMEHSLPVVASDVTGVVASRNAAGMVTVDVNTADVDDVYAGGETAAGSGVWNSVTLTKTDDITEASDTVVLYTDIAAPTDKLFTDRYMTEMRDDIFAADTLDAYLKLARSDAFPDGSSTTLTYGEEGGLAKSLAGTFDGVPGNFVCMSPTCSITTNAKGELASVGADETWRFSPTAPNTATVKEPDVAYAYFGWWLNKPKKNDDPHMVDVFAGGTVEHAATPDSAILGTAKYAGTAAGKYVTKNLSAGVHSDSGVGHFTANANLTADFGEAGDAGNIGGSVTGFVLDDVTAASSWKVILEDAPISGANFVGSTEVTFGGPTTATDAGVGDWQGSFYGAGAGTDDAPSTVAGTFDAVTDSAAVIGGFGATKVKK